MRLLKKIAKAIFPPQIWSLLKFLFLKKKKEIVFIKDYFQSGQTQRVLLSYITTPFITADHTTHTNRQECYAIAEIFHEKGYSVDIATYDSDIDIDYSGYDCIFGFGEPLCKSFNQNTSNPVRIYYATEAHISWNNFATLKRALEVYAKKNVWLLDSCRIARQTWPQQTTLVDAIIVLGGAWGTKIYKQHYDGKIISLYPSYNADISRALLASKNFALTRDHYLWFGSVGAIHKGLDWLLEIFSEYPEKTLHIAGLVENEKEFMAAYSKEFSLHNIVLHGFVDVQSLKFRELMLQCAFVILPSCSEGLSTSLLNTMCNGLIPIATLESGFDFTQSFIPIQALNINATRSAILESNSLSLQEIAQRSNACLNDVRTKYNIQEFKKKMESTIECLLTRTNTFE